MKKRLRILYLEDNPRDAQLVQATLKSQGTALELTLVDARDEFSAALRKNNYDVILSDYTLPSYDGTSALKLAKELCPDTPFIFVSGTMGEETVIQSLLNGATDYVLKQKISRLVPAVERALHEAENQRERKRMEETLTAERLMLRTVIDNLPDQIYVKDSNSHFLLCNKSVALNAGATSDQDLIGKTDFDIFPSELAKQYLTDEQTIITSGQPLIDREEPIVNKRTGELQWNLTTKVPLKDSTGKILGLVGVNRDITERKQAEQTLRANERRLQTLVGSIDEIVFEFDEESTYINIWTTNERLLIRPKNELIGRRAAEFLGEEFVRPFTEIYRRVLTTGQPETFEYAMDLSRDKRWFLARVAPLPSAHGVYETVCMSARDITERKRMEEALVERDIQYRRLIDNIPDVLWTANDQGDAVFISARITAVFGYTPDEIYRDGHQLWFGKIHPDDVERVREAYTKLFAENKPFGIEYRICHRDGHWMWWYDRAVAIYEQYGKRYADGLLSDVTERKRAEEELHKSEQRYRELFENNPQPMWVYDLETLSFLAVNDAAVNHYGYSRDEFLAMTIKDIRPPEDIPALVQNLQRSTADLEKASQWRHHKKDGTFIDVEITSHTLRFSGRPARLVAVNDVTERKRAEEALRQSEDRYRRLVESSPVAIIIHTEGKIVYANGEAAKLLAAQTPNELIGKSILGFAHPDYREIVQERLRQVRKGGDVPLVEEKFIRLDRVVIDIEVAGIPFMYQGKLGAQVIFRDITERKRAEEAIRKSEEKYRNLFEESKDVIFISSPEGKFLDINPAGVNLFGYSTKQELLGVDIDQDLYGDPKERETLHHILEQHGFVRDYELIAKKKDGQKLFLLETVTAVRDAAGNVLSYRGIIRDETQRKQLEQQLFQTQKMESLGTLASGIAHDFNNILGIVMGHASLIEMSKNKPEDFPASIKALNNAARRGAGLVRQLLTFARKSELLFEPVSIHSTVDEITRLLGETFPKTITTVTKIEQHLPMIHADATQLHQVMLNLCVNARDAMPRGGTLSITATRVTCEAVRHTFPKASASEYIAINVSDTGMGMDEATKKRIFEPFFTTKDRDKGTGLGLATVYGIIQSHHGFIDVESTIGKGTTFYLYFPVQQSADDNLRSKEGEREEIAGGAETILVVEDEEMLRELVKTILSTKGYTILTANDGVQAIEVYKNHALEIALVLSDVGLPKLEGTEVFLKVKDLNPKVKVILASGFWDPEMKAALFGSGIKDCIQKPYSPNELLKSVRRVLDE